MAKNALEVKSGTLKITPNASTSDGSLGEMKMTSAGVLQTWNGSAWVSVPVTATSTDNAVARFDGTGGNVQNSAVIIDDSNNVSGVVNLTTTGTVATTGTTIGLGTSNSATTANIASGTNTNTINLGGASTTTNVTGTTAVSGTLGVSGTVAVTGTTVGLGTSNTATTVNLGSGSGANTINIGGASSTVNITGTVNNQNVTNLNVTDKLITLNDGGAAASGGATGVEVEENAVITGYIKTSADRNSWEFLAPNTAGVISLTTGASTDVVTLNAATQTLTNKTIDSDNNTITNIVDADIKAAAAIARTKIANGTANHVVINDGSGALSSEASLAISRGGTGQATQTAAFDALAPTTTKGDIIVSNGSDNIRLAVGTNAYVLTADSGETSGIKWAALGVGAKAYANKTTTYTLTATDDVITADGTGGAFTLTLPAAASNTGKVFHIKKTDSTVNAITIDGNASETIDGSTTTQLNTQYEAITIVSDGTNWQMIDRKTDKAWISYTPTGSWSTNTTYTGKWRRVGDSAEYTVMISLAGAPTSAALTINQPSGHTIDTAKMAAGTDSQNMFFGEVSILDAATANFLGTVGYSSTTAVKIYYMYIPAGIGRTDPVTQAAPMTFASGDYVFIKYSVPIANWSA